MFRTCSYFICQSKRIENDQTKLTAQCTSHAATQANTSLEWSRPCSAAAWEKSCSLARLAKLGWLWHFGFLDYFSSSPNMIWMKTPFPCCALLISTQRLSISSSFPGLLSVQVAKSQTLAIAFEDETSSQYATTWGQQHLPQEDSIRKKNRTQSTRSHNMQCANAKVMFDNFCTLTYYIPYCFWTAVVVLQTNCFVHLFLHQQEESFRHRAMKNNIFIQRAKDIQVIKYPTHKHCLTPPVNLHRGKGGSWHNPKHSIMVQKIDVSLPKIWPNMLEGQS